VPGDRAEPYHTAPTRAAGAGAGRRCSCVSGCARSRGTGQGLAIGSAHTLWRREGWMVNRKRVHRLWRGERGSDQQGLRVRPYAMEAASGGDEQGADEAASS